MNHLINLGVHDKAVLNWLIDIAQDWEGSLTGNPDPEPLKTFKDNISNARKIIRYIFSDDTVVEAELWKTFLTMPVSQLKRYGQDDCAMKDYRLCEQSRLPEFANRVLAKNKQYWVQKPSPQPSQTRKPSQDATVKEKRNKTQQLRKRTNRRSR